MPQVPVGVISADAIEQLDPLVPLPVAGEDLSPLATTSTAGLRQPLSLPVRSGAVQLICTTVPLVAIDLVAIATSILLAVWALSPFGIHPHVNMPWQGLGVLVSYLFIGSYFGLFPATAMSPVLELRQLVRGTALAFALVLLSNQLFASLSASETYLGVMAATIACVLVPLARAMGRYQLGRCSWWGERGVVIGSGPQGQAIFNFYRRAASRGLRPIGLVDLETPDSPAYIERSSDQEAPLLGTIHDVSRLTREFDLRWGIVAPAGSGALSMNEVMKFSASLKHLIVLPSQFLLPSLWANARECAGVLGVHVTDQLRRPASRAIKTLVDVLVALMALIVTAPLIAVFVAWIKLKSPGPAFYGHKRIGRGGRPFKAWKLRTMVANADSVLEEFLENDPEARRQWIEDQKLKEDPRIIAGIGHFLRKTSLDELPQLFNVLMGDMSLVGPRPIVTSEIARYGEMYPLYLRVTPGITGLWQISGRNDTSYAQRVRFDCYYVCNWSLWLDAYIALRTVRTLLMREGAY